MENLLFLGVPILKHIRVGVTFEINPPPHEIKIGVVFEIITPRFVKLKLRTSGIYCNQDEIGCGRFS